VTVGEAMSGAASVVRLPVLREGAGEGSGAGAGAGAGASANDGAGASVSRFLREQADLTAVERFAREHDAGAEGRYYRDLIPSGRPGSGQQYAFQVDLDACTGCKACVAACHSLNGLDEGEVWRSVGLLHGGTPVAPVQQSVTTACHHCLDPACMNGCPVGAYEKDALTGIVKHLDDQCIGCQYCVFTCPYEVPRFNERIGIVRKCDMCGDRLAAGEAPACVQGCPNSAIAIAIVEKRQVLEDAQGDAFLPGAPSPGITVPATTYKTQRPLPRNLLPADFYAVRPSHKHAPLVVMLVLTQLSAGAFVVDAVASRVLPAGVLAALRPTHAVAALTAGLLALAASIFHLGRPRYAYRALLGLRTSWMSREILAFGVFAPLAAAYAALLWQGALLPLAGIPPLAESVAGPLQDAACVAVAAAGAAGVACSVLLYDATRRAWWSASTVAFKFAMTAAVLGLAATMATSLAAASSLVPSLAGLLAVATSVKLAGELAFFRHLRRKRHDERKRSAMLMKGDLARYTAARFLAGAIGGVLLPLLVRADAAAATATVTWAPPLVAASLVLLLAGELLERTLFFAAATSPRMPGTLP
jgi:Fe-S-cluster-containing dehydrogenase component/DMSO reductase anchor subunit